MNIRKLAASAMIAVLLILSITSVHAGNYSTRQLFITDFSVGTFNGIESGIFYGAMYDSDDHFSPVMLTLYDGSAITYEDMLSYNTYITGTFELDENGYDTDIVKIYSEEYNKYFTFAWRYMDDGSLYTVSEVYQSNTSDVYYAKLNGEWVQVFGYVENGTAYILREANPLGNAGYILQHGAIIRYAATEKEETPVQHSVFVPIAQS